MPSSPLTDTRIPDLDYANDPPADITNAVTDLESYTRPRFADSTERDLKYAAWVAAGGTLEDGMTCAVAGLLQKRVDGAWVSDEGSEGVIGYNPSTSTISTSGTAEMRLAGPQNMVVSLRPGRAYEAIARGKASMAGAAGLATVRLRAARGATPTTSSSTVSSVTVYCPSAGGTGQVSFSTTGQPFAVGTASTQWQIHWFGQVAVGGTSMSVVPEVTGVLSLMVRDCGPATADVPII